MMSAARIWTNIWMSTALVHLLSRIKFQSLTKKHVPAVQKHGDFSMESLRQRINAHRSDIALVLPANSKDRNRSAKFKEPEGIRSALLG